MVLVVGWLSVITVKLFEDDGVREQHAARMHEERTARDARAALHLNADSDSSHTSTKVSKVEMQRGLGSTESPMARQNDLLDGTDGTATLPNAEHEVKTASGTCNLLHYSCPF